MGDDTCAGDTDRDNLAEYTIAPQHGMDLAELDPYIIEGVAYSPLKMTFLSSGYDEGLELRCDSCKWTTTVGELPEDAGYVQPDMCPDCAKEGELGFVRCQSPADGTFPSGWNRSVDTDSEHGGDKIEGEHITELHEFLDDMGSNPLGDGQRVRQVGRYVVEHYADTFTIDDRVRPRLQIFRRVHDDEEHFRDWKHIANDDDFEVDDIAELWKTITERDIDDVVDDG